MYLKDFKSWVFLMFILFSINSYSQSPEKFTYQSIVRNADGLVLKSSDIGIRISVLKNSNNGVSVYTESHTTSSNKNGLVTLLIGEGTSSDSFSAIDWSTGQYYLKVELDPMGGIDYSIEQSSQLLSVPYALYSSRSSNIDLTKDVKGILPVLEGGTGSTTAPMIALVTANNAQMARDILGVDAAGTGGSNVVLTDVKDNYLTISDSSVNASDQEITAGIVPVTLGGTGSATAPMVGVITAADAAAARTAIGAGTIATQNKDAVDVDGGVIDGTVIGRNAPSTGVFTSVNSGLIQSVGDTDIIIKTGNDTTGNITLANGADGKILISPNGTGSVVIDDLTFPSADGSANQILKTDGSGILSWTDNLFYVVKLDSLSKLSVADGNIIVGDGTNFVVESGATARTSLGLGSVATQNKDAVDVDGGAIDGTVIGASAPSTGIFTSVNSGLIQSVGDTDIIIKTGNDTTGNITLANGADGKILISPNGTGSVVIDDLTFPSADGSANQILKTDGSGVLSWIDNLDYNVKLDSLSKLSVADGNIIVGDGTNFVVESGATARTSLGLGSVATQNKDAVDVDGGAIDGTVIGASAPSTGIFTSVNSGLIQSVGDTDIIIKTGNDTTGNITLANGADGKILISPNGTGSVVIDDLTFPSADGSANQILKTDGSGVLSWIDNLDYNVKLDSLSKLSVADGNIIVGDGTNFVVESGATARTSLGLGSVATQNKDAVDVDGGAIDGTVIGASAPSTGIFTSVNSGLIQSVGDTDIIIKTGNVTTGDLTISDGANGNINITPNGTGKVIAKNTDLTGTTSFAGTALTISAAELNMLDGDNSPADITLANADRIIVNDDGIMKQVAIPSIGAFLTSLVNIDVLTDAKSDGTNFTDGLSIGHPMTASTLNDAIGNIAVGLTALDALTEGDYNVAVGDDALTANTTGNENTAIGAYALTSNVDGFSNTAVGVEALEANVSGDLNTAIGLEALEANVSGNNNTAIGSDALKLNVDGEFNVAVGSKSLADNTTTGNTAIGFESSNKNVGGASNTAVGFRSSKFNVTGSNNTAIGVRSILGVSTNSNSGNTAVGYESGKNITTGSDNVMVGLSAGNNITTGNQNVFIGKTARASGAGIDNEIVIGSGTTGLGTNKAVIGNASITDVYMSQDSGATVYASGMAVVDESDLTIGNVAGDLYLKVSPSATVGNEDIRIVNNVGTAEASVQVTSIAGGIDMDAAAAKDINIAGGQVALVSKDEGNSAISLLTNVGTSETITITNTQGTGASAVNITSSAGGVAINSSSTTVSGALSVAGNLSSTSGNIAGFDATLNAVTSFSSNNYTLVASDNGKVITLDNGTTASTLTIPTGLGDGFNCLIVQKANHDTTITAGSGVTLFNRSTQVITAGRYAIVTLVNIGSENYILSGDTK